MAANKRDDIMKAALVLFAERGYDGTTVPMIADRAQVGAGTIYRYFENKESLVNALFQQCVAEFSDTLKLDLIYSASHMREQFHIIFQQLIKFAGYNLHALLFINSHSSAYYLDEQSKMVFNKFLGIFRRIIEDGKEKGIIKNMETDALIVIVYGAFVLLYNLIKTEVIIESPKLLNDVEQSCWDAIRIIES